MLNGSVTSPVANINGFLLSERVRGITTYETLALNELDPVAQASGYRPWWEIVPPNNNHTLPAYGSFQYQFAMPPGSVLWGYQFGSFDGTFSGLVSLQITNTVLEETLFSDFIQGNGQSYFGGNLEWSGINLLPAPVVIIEPGTLAAELGSLSASTIVGNIQLILYFQVPEQFCQGPQNWSEGVLIR